MATAPNKRFSTSEEYLAFEIQAKSKHEYFRGEVFQMTGASRVHNLLTLQVGSLINRHLEGSPCEVYSNDMRVKVTANGLYAYPDVAIACPPIEFERINGAETLLNPVALVEVLSPTTEAFDRGDKFRLYAAMPSLKEYCLVSQIAHQIDYFHRDDDGSWKMLMFSGLNETLRLQTIRCDLPLARIYEKIAFSISERPDESHA